VIRSERRVLLVQLVHGENIDTSAGDMLAALESITVY
jgi:hypothetical protein